MAININQLNVPAMAALANQRVGQLNFPIAAVQPGLFQQNAVQTALASQEIKTKQDAIKMQMLIEQLQQQGLDRRQAEELVAGAQLEQYKQQQANSRTAVTQQGAMDRQRMQTQLGYDQLGAQTEYNQGQLGMRQAELENIANYRNQDIQAKQQQLQLERYKTDLQERMKLGEQKLDQRSGLSASYLKERNKISDPNKLAIMDKNYIDLLQKMGLADSKFVNTFSNAPPELKNAILGGDVTMNKAAVSFYNSATKRSDIQEAIAAANEAAIAAGKEPLTKEQEADLIMQNAVNAPKKGVAAQNVNPVEAGLQSMDIDRVKKAVDAASTSDNNLQTINAMREANKNFQTGIFGANKLAAQQAYQAITGNTLDSTAYGEALGATGMKFIQQLIQQTKGAISDAEMRAFEKASPGLRTSNIGNEYILNMLESAEIRKKELASQMRNYIEQKGNLKGFEDYWSKYSQESLAIDKTTFKIMRPGDEYTDAKGNKARYLGGNPDKQESWQEIQ